MPPVIPWKVYTIEGNGQGLNSDVTTLDTVYKVRLSASSYTIDYKLLPSSTLLQNTTIVC